MKKTLEWYEQYRAEEGEFDKPKVDLSQALKELEKSLNEMQTALNEVRQAIRNESNED